MPPKKDTVELSEAELAKVEAFVNDGKRPVRAVQRSRILLMAGDGTPDHQIIDALDCGESTQYDVRKRSADPGVDVIHRKSPGRTYERKLAGEPAARLIALASSDPPEGRARWTVRLIANEQVKLGKIEFDTIAHEAVRKTLRKTNYCHISNENG